MNYNNLSEVLTDISNNIDSIKNDYNNSDPQAMEVMDLLRMHLRCPMDPGAQGLLMASYEVYKKNKSNC